MSNNNWLNNIKHVAAGEPVEAGVVSRPDRTLADRTEYLKHRLDAAELGRAVFDTGATIAPDVLPGQPVYWNATTQCYEKALAAVENNATTQTLITTPSSDCVGLCFNKKSSTLGDIVLQGIVRFPPAAPGLANDLANAITGPIAPGKYYLSAVEPGKLVKQRPPVTVTVCHVLGPKDACSADTPWVIVAPQTRDFLEDHVHYRFELVARPAGTHNPTTAASSGQHAITNPTVLRKGWLPANHASFNGRAPVGAAFGYNLAQHPELSSVWPPLPLQAVALLWDKGANKVGATEIPLGTTGLCVVDANGIWWMSNCYGDAPWPATLSTDGLSDGAAETAQGVTPECPRNEAMRLSVVFLRMVFGNDRSVVTSLRPAANSPITVQSCDGGEATTGDLQLGLNLTIVDDPTEIAGGRAYKQITNDFKFRKGWVTEGLRLGAGPLTLTGTRSRVLSAAEKTTLGLPGTDTSLLYQGLVTVSYNDQLVEREISPQIIRLSDTVERLYKDIPYLGFPAGQTSLLRVRLNVPGANLGATLQMKIRAQLFGRATAVLPTLTMSYRRLARPASGGMALPANDAALTFTVPTTSINIDTAVEVESAVFSVSEGDTVLLTLSRAGATDNYGAEVGLLRMTGIVFVP